MPKSPNLTATVIVPSMTGRRVADLLRSLAGQTVEVEVIVVDNASPGREVTRACAGFSFARPLKAERNLGFGAAVNRAARDAGGDALVIVNDDATYDPPFVAEIVAALDSGPGVVMAAGVMRERRRPDLIETAGIEIDRTLLAFDYLNGEPLVAAQPGIPEPLGPSGVAAAFRRDAFHAAGGYDDRLFAYWEDTDLALTLHSLGGGCALATRALGTHQHSATLGPGSPRKNFLMGFGRGYVLRKWDVLQPRRLPSILARELVVCAGQALHDRNVAGVKGRVQGLRAARMVWRPYPAEAVAASPAGGSRGSLLRRARRRRRLNRS